MSERTNLEALARISRYFGKNPDFVLAGGGNTSFKDGETLYVKASGSPLSDATAGDFVALSRKKLRAMTEQNYPAEAVLREERVKSDLLDSRLFPEKGQRPSVESNFHEIIDYPWVVHLHPCAVNALTCSKEGRTRAEKIFGDRFAWVRYVDPGYKLAMAVKAAVDARRRRGGVPGIILMQNHGIIAAGATPGEVKKTIRNAVSAIKKEIGIDIPVHISGRKRKITPRIRDISLMLKGAFGERRKIIYPADIGGIEKVLSGKTGPMTPDQIVYCRPEAARIGGKNITVEGIENTISGYEKKHGYPPALFIVPGCGIFGAGDDFSSARNSANAFWDMARTVLAAGSFGGARFLTRKETSFIDSWEAENYRRRAASAGPGELTGLSAVITGAARGVGKGIAEALAERGAHVVIADINIEQAEKTASGIRAKFGENRALAFKTDITDERAVEALFERAVREYGGIDLLVNNAGILVSGNILDLKYGDFRKVIEINLNASFLCARKAAGIMSVQNRGDIIQMSSKSGKTGSRNNSAYASSKFANIGLVQSIAMDLIGSNIYVNALCPGNFLDLDLWQGPGGLLDQYLRAGKVPGAKTRQDVEAYYKKQTLLGRGCTVEDIVETIIYVLRQRGETGQAYNVTQGQSFH